MGPGCKIYTINLGIKGMENQSASNRHLCTSVVDEKEADQVLQATLWCNTFICWSASYLKESWVWVGPTTSRSEWVTVPHTRELTDGFSCVYCIFLHKKNIISGNISSISFSADCAIQFEQICYFIYYTIWDHFIYKSKIN